MDWQAALAKLDASKLSAPARADLASLKTTVAADLTQLDSDAAALAELAPLMPFATTLIDLSEARIRLEDVDSRKAAGQLTAVTRQIAEMRARLEKEPGAVPGLTKEVAARGADAVDGLRNSMTTWFNFSNGYDPVFTWWMGMPFPQLDAALQGYAVPPATRSAGRCSTPRATAAPIAAAPASAIAEVPDLEALLRLPQDEMTPIVERFVTPPAADRADTAPGGSRGNAAGGRAATNNPGSGRPKQHYIDWLAALKTLDFDVLSPQRAGRLPVHQADAASEHRPRRRVARSGPAAQDRQHGHPGAATRARGADPGSRGRT